METASSAKNKIDLIQTAIQQLIDSKQTHLHNNNNNNNNDEDHHHLLTNLLSQLEALKADGVLDPPEPVAESEESSCKSAETERKCEDETETSKSTTVSESEDVVKELKKLEKQNRVTHWLLSTLILLTVAWQLSEVSLLLKMKEGVTHPFRSIGNVFKDIFKRPRRNGQEHSQLPLVELPDLVLKDENK